MVLEQECQAQVGKKFCHAEEQKAEKPWVFNTIKKRDEISQLFNEGKFVSFKYFSVIYVSSENPGIAFIAGKKAGNSVKRNKMRRKLKRVYLEHKSWFDDKRALLVAKRSLFEADDAAVKQNFERVIRRNIEKNG